MCTSVKPAEQLGGCLFRVERAFHSRTTDVETGSPAESEVRPKVHYYGER